MRKFPTVLAGIAIVTAILACNLPSSQSDPAAIMTAAALTVQAQLSPTVPPQATATNTPAPFPTLPLSTLTPLSTPTSSCDNARFVTDVTYPDNTVVPAGANFTKTWRFQNIGTCSWTPSYNLVFMSGESMNGPSVQALIGNVNPGQTVDVSVDLTAPSNSGTHVGNWGLRNAAGVIFAHFYVQIKVGGGGGAFAVTSISYDVSGTCGGFHITAHITTNGPGTVKYYWEFNGNDPDEGTFGSTLDFNSAGTKSTPVLDWSISASGDHYAQVYIESPNHQFIGQANVHCP